MAFAVGFPVHSIRLERGEDGTLGTSYTTPAGGVEVAWLVSLVKVSGVVAEAVAYGSDPGLLAVEHFIRDSKDAQTMREYLRTIAGGGMLLTPLLVAAAYSDAYLREHWAAVERFAAELDRHGVEWADPDPPTAADSQMLTWDEAKGTEAYRSIAAKLSLA